MAEEISEYYKEKGFVRLYVWVNKEPRRVAMLYRPDGTCKVHSYAKYLYTSHYKIDIPEGYEVDHINNNKMDDRIENYQLLTGADNRRKSSIPRIMVTLTCPVCGTEFQYRKRDLCGHPNPCCSRRCGGIQAHRTSMEKGTYRHIAHKKTIPFTYDEAMNKHTELKTWDKVAEYYNVSLATMKRYLAKLKNINI